MSKLDLPYFVNILWYPIDILGLPVYSGSIERGLDLQWFVRNLAKMFRTRIASSWLVRTSAWCVLVHPITYKWNTFATSIGQASSTMSAHILQSWIIVKRCQVSHIYPGIVLPPFMSGFLLHSFHKGMEWLFCRMGPDHFGPCRLLSFVSNCSHMELIIGPHESLQNHSIWLTRLVWWVLDRGYGQMTYWQLSGWPCW